MHIKINRLNQASIADARRRIALMETTIAGFEKTIRDLERWIEAERSQPGVRYVSTLTNSLTQRPDTM